MSLTLANGHLLLQVLLKCTRQILEQQVSWLIDLLNLHQLLGEAD